MAAGIIEHEGRVSRVERDAVFVKITSQSACGTCKAREACGLSESQDKIIEVHTSDAVQYAPDDAVMVGIRKGTGGLAVLLAYVAALGVLLALLLFGIQVMRWNEGLVAAVALGGVVAYYGVLWLFRAKIETKIKITITKNY